MLINLLFDGLSRAVVELQRIQEIEMIFYNSKPHVQSNCKCENFTLQENNFVTRIDSIHVSMMRACAIKRRVKDE